jgi:hypothetical protein
MLIVPLQPTPAQQVYVNVLNQACTIRVYQKFYGLFMDLLVNNTLVIGGVQCLNGARIVQSLYLGFQGDFAWTDVTGNSDPSYSGIATRFFLNYLEPSNLPPGVG